MKIAKMQYFRLFCKNILKPCVKFSRVWTKNTISQGKFEKILKFFDENQQKNWIFTYFREILLLKIEPSEITSFFYNNFSGSVEAGLNPLTTLRRKLSRRKERFNQVNILHFDNSQEEQFLPDFAGGGITGAMGRGTFNIEEKNLAFLKNFKNQ